MINALGQRTILQGHQSLITNQFSVLIRCSFVVSINFFTPPMTGPFLLDATKCGRSYTAPTVAKLASDESLGKAPSWTLRTDRFQPRDTQAVAFVVPEQITFYIYLVADIA